MHDERLASGLAASRRAWELERREKSTADVHETASSGVPHAPLATSSSAIGRVWFGVGGNEWTHFHLYVIVLFCGTSTRESPDETSTAVRNALLRASDVLWEREAKNKGERTESKHKLIKEGVRKTECEQQRRKTKKCEEDKENAKERKNEQGNTHGAQTKKKSPARTTRNKEQVEESRENTEERRCKMIY